MKHTFLFLLILLTSLWSSAQTDQLSTNKGGDITLTPILHATMVLQWNGKTIYMDPYGGAERFANFPAPDLILITHIHGDHLNKETLKGLDLNNTELIAPQSVVDELGAEITFKKIHPLKNGEEIKRKGVKVMAVPMYNLPETADSRHPKGRGNGYVLNVGGKRLYISGDTEDIQEMRQLKDIDYAFVCMNLPYTMDINQAASAVLDFKPKVVYPFHFRGGSGKFSDVEKFKEMVNTGNPNIEVRLRDWYPEKPSTITDEELLYQLMQGSFNSAEQAAADSAFYNITLHMYPIWEKDDAKWLYVEQAVSQMQDKPYRQRVYKVEKTGDNHYQSVVYTLKDEANFVGKWSEPKFFDQYDTSILEERDGCAVLLEKTGPKTFSGSTQDDNCKSSLRGARYATSQVTIKDGTIISWDRGFDQNGKQVWGATQGGYIFEKK